jgi:hypothetical protein
MADAVSTELAILATQAVPETAGPAGASVTFAIFGSLAEVGDFLPPNTAAIGIPETTDAFRSAPAEVIAALPGAGRIILALGDTSVADVNLASERLGQIASAAGLDVSYLSLESLPALLGAFAADKRPAVLAGLLSQAKSKLPARRIPRSSQIAPKVDFVLALIVHGEGENQTVLAEFAACRLRTVTVVDDIAVTVRGKAESVRVFHDLAVAYRHPQTGLIVETELHSVADELLSQPRLWLNRITNGGAGIVLHPNSGLVSGVEQAIRAARADAVLLETSFARFGWVKTDEGFGYLTPDGAVTASGLLPSHSASVDNKISISTSPPALHSRPWGYWAKALDLIDQATAAVLTGQAISTWAGFTPTGTVFLAGTPESGKTHLTSFLAALTNPRYSPGSPMCTFDSTAAALRASLTGMHQSLLIVDDKREGSSDASGRPSRDSIAQAEGMESLIRLGYGGPEAGFSKLTQDRATGKWSNTGGDRSHPGVVLVGEKVSPDMPMSTLQRILVVNITRETSFRGGNARGLEDLLSEGENFHSTLFDFLSWVAARRDGFVSETAWLEEGARRRRVAEDEIAALHPELSPRALTVASFPLMGMTLLAEYLTERDADDTFVVDLPDAVVNAAELIGGAQATHWAGISQSAAEPWEQIAALLRQAVASGRVTLLSKTTDGNSGLGDDLLFVPGEYAQTIGWYPESLHADGQRWVALLPGEVRRALSGTRFAGMSDTSLMQAFAKVQLRSPNGSLGLRATVRGARIRVLALPLHVWLDCAADDVPPARVVEFPPAVQAAIRADLAALRAAQ